jgi:peptide/nickel transport system permease protein
MSEKTQAENNKPVRLGAEDADPNKPRTLMGDTWRQFRKHKLAVAASIVLAIIIITVIVGPPIWRAIACEAGERNCAGNPTYVDIMAMLDFNNRVSTISADHPLGVDNTGRDMLARMFLGGRVSLSIGFAAMLLAMTLGTTVGLLAGYFKWLDSPLMRLTDLFLSLPQLPLLLVVTMLFRDPLRQFFVGINAWLGNFDNAFANSIRPAFGPELGIFVLTVIIIGMLGWMPTARLVRGEVLSVKEREFVLAARSVGATDVSIVFKHILPNVLSPVIVAATFSIAQAIITESALSFLGLGFPPDFPTWGRLLADGKDFYTLTPLGVLFPGLAISVTVMCVNFIGDGLRDALDPRLRK